MNCAVQECSGYAVSFNGKCMVAEVGECSQHSGWSGAVVIVTQEVLC